ncbi:uncharacterized protein ISCGN_026787 [Ixodes scapularis]
MEPFPYFCVYDFEAILEAENMGQAYEKHVPSSFCILVIRSTDSRIVEQFLYRGEDCVEKFISILNQLSKLIGEWIRSEEVPMGALDFTPKRGKKICLSNFEIDVSAVDVEPNPSRCVVTPEFKPLECRCCREMDRKLTDLQLRSHIETSATGEPPAVPQARQLLIPGTKWPALSVPSVPVPHTARRCGTKWPALSAPLVPVPHTARRCPRKERFHTPSRFHATDSVAEPGALPFRGRFASARRGGQGAAQATEQVSWAQALSSKAERGCRRGVGHNPQDYWFVVVSNGFARRENAGTDLLLLHCIVLRFICTYVINQFYKKDYRTIVHWDLRPAHPLWGHAYANPRGNLLHKLIEDMYLTLVTDPTNSTRLGTSVTRDTTPDLTLTRSITQADWTNLEEYLGSDHALLATTLHGLK